MNCKKCGSPLVFDGSGVFECGSWAPGVGKHQSIACGLRERLAAITKERDAMKRDLAEANEYARKLNLKITDLCAERDAAKARNQRLMDAGGRLFEELDDKTPEPNCRCHVFPPCSDCTNNASARLALAEWKEAITESTLKPVVRYVEEVNGGMGPDYAEIYLTTGHVIQVNDEGLLLWPSVEAYESGENCQIVGFVAFESKEVKP